MRRILAIAWLTWKAAFRFRLFLALAALLVAAVAGLPLLIKDDGTARGLVQILITYTLAAATALLGLATLWLACGTLARDIEECQMQMVAVKPVARWQVWLGKWLGILSLNALLLALAGASLYAVLQTRAARLTPPQQRILREELLVARASLREPAPQIQPDVERLFQQRIADKNLSPEDRAEVRKQTEAQVMAQLQIVPPGMMRRWELDASGLRERLAGKVLFLRIKFFTAEMRPDATYPTRWRIGPADAPRARDVELQLPPEAFHEIALPAELIGADGKLIIHCMNIGQAPLLFTLEDGLEVLWPESSFEVNLLRGLFIIWCWLALLAALGLAAASFLSFPVAAFVAMMVLVMAFATGTLSSTVEGGTVFGRNQETGVASNPILDKALLPVFKGALEVIALAQSFSPVDALSTGRSVTWGQTVRAFVQIVLLLGGGCAIVGVVTFTRRELATAQGNNG